MYRHLRVLVLALLALAGCGAPEPPPEPSCATPRAAADSLLVWQAEPHHDLARATRCVEAPPGQAQRLAVQLKQVLDARGLYVPVHQLSDDPEHVDEEGRARVQPFLDFPLVLVRGDDGAWRYSRQTMDAVPRLYEQTFSAFTLELQERLPGPFFHRIAGLYVWQLVFGVALLGLSWCVGALVRRVLYVRALGLARRFGLLVDAGVWRGTDRPLIASAMCAVLLWGLPQLQLPIGVSRFAVGAVDLTLRLTGTWLALRLVDVLADIARRQAARTESKLDDQLVPLLRSAASALTIALGSLFVLQALGVDVWKLLAGVSVGGLIVGLAAQDTVKNFFGSINVFVDQPFQIGDWVVVNGVEGTVEEVGFRSTRIRTFYNSQVTLPNSSLTNANVDNMGRRPRRRVKTTLHLRYDTPADVVQAFVEGIRAVLKAHPAVHDAQQVHLYDLGHSSIEILVYYHLVVPDWQAELVGRSQNLLEILRLADELGVRFALPSTSLYVEATPDHPLPALQPRSVEELAQVIEAFGPGGSHARPHGPVLPVQFKAGGGAAT